MDDPIERRRMVERDVPYEIIDEEFRPLIRELNEMGLETTQSCCGHDGQKPAYVSLKMDNILDVAVRDRGKRLVIWWRRGNG